MTDDLTLIDRKATAGILGLSIRTIDRYVTQRLIPYVKYPGGQIRFKKVDLLKWIERKTVRANPFAA